MHQREMAHMDMIRTICMHVKWLLGGLDNTLNKWLVAHLGSSAVVLVAKGKALYSFQFVLLVLFLAIFMNSIILMNSIIFMNGIIVMWGGR